MRLLPVFAISGVAVIGLALAACGGDDDGYGSGGNATQPTATSATAPSNSPTAGPSTAATQPPQTNASAVKVSSNAKFGQFLTDANGMTLYVFTPDAPGKSTCNTGCASTWPALTTNATTAPKVEGATGTFTIINRDDGGKQLAYNGAPLYTYKGDKAPGDTSGDGVGDVWFVAKAAASGGAAVTPASSTTGSDYGY
jgi:predicted lipoprotein with Yx(FWY)xxD motif